MPKNIFKHLFSGNWPPNKQASKQENESPGQLFIGCLFPSMCYKLFLMKRKISSACHPSHLFPFAFLYASQYLNIFIDVCFQKTPGNSTVLPSFHFIALPMVMLTYLVNYLIRVVCRQLLSLLLLIIHHSDMK